MKPDPLLDIVRPVKTIKEVFASASAKEEGIRKLRARLAELDANAERLRLKRMRLYDAIALYAQGRLSFEGAMKGLSDV